MKSIFILPKYFGFKAFLPLFFLLYHFNAGAQNMFCGTPKHEHPTGGNFFPASCEYLDNSGTYVIPVIVHNFTGENITAKMRQALVYTNHLLKVKSNGDFFPQKIILKMAELDIDGACFNGVKNYNFAAVGSYENINNFVTTNFPNGSSEIYKQRYLNIIVSHINGRYSGFAPFPIFADVFPGVFLNSVDVQTGFWFDVSKTLAHEFGHWCYLIHTHTEYGDTPCPQDKCAGDMVESTNPGPVIFQNIPGESTLLPLPCVDYNGCNNVDKPFDTRNVMTYYCKEVFEQEQINRMTVYLNEYRSHLFSSQNYTLTFKNFGDALENEVTFSNTTLTNKLYKVEEGTTIYIDGDVIMNGCSFQMGWGSKVVLKENANLTLTGTSFNSQCDRTVWEGITVENNARMETSNACTVAGANIGLHAKYGSTIYIDQTNFLDNTICIKLGETGGNGNVDNWISNCGFKGKFYSYRAEDPFAFGSVQIAIDAHHCGVLTVVGNNVFDECRTAVSSINTITYIGVNNEVKDCFNGFIVKNTKKNPVYIFENSIKAKLYGIDISNANVYVYNNDIYVNNDIQQNPESPSKCMNLISCVPIELSSSGDAGVTDNILRTRNSSDYLIYSGWNTGVGFSNNECSTDFSGNVRVIYGFQSNFIDNEKLYCESLQLRLNTASTYHNNITGGLISDGCRRNLYTNNQFFFASNIKSSLGGIYRCNQFTSQSEINYNCLGSDFQSNEFAFEFDLKGSGTMISPQINKGNTFYNSIGNYDTEEDNLENNQFIVKNQLPYYPGTINGPAAWFLPNGDNIQPECQPINGIPTWGGDRYTKCLDSLFMGTKYRKLSSRQKWIMLFNLYRIYTLNGKKMPLTLSPCAKSILQTYKTKDIGKLADIYDKIDSLRGLKPEGNATMQLTAASDGLYTLINTPTTTLSEFKAQANVIKNKFISQQSERIAHDNAYTTLKTEILAEVGAIRSLAVEEPAIHMVELIPMLIASIDDNDAYFDANKMDYLNDVASLCDNDAGEAKYIAASIYEKITGIDVLRDGVGCTTELRSQPNITKNNQIKIYPNPASDHITLESNTACRVDIYHITGQQVLSTQVVPSGQIDISGLKDGVYIVRCKGTDGTSAVSKIIKQ
jgi:Secretion system C-terminal sorting domain/Pregnancy-associated plasma protein-A